MIVGGCKAPQLFKQRLCSVLCAMQPSRSAAQATCAALGSIVAPATLAAKSTREPEAAILEGRFPQLGGPLRPGNRGGQAHKVPLIPEIVRVGLTR